MNKAPTRRARICAALILAPSLVLAQDDSHSVEEIDTVTIIGRRADVADVPGSAHIIDS